MDTMLYRIAIGILGAALLLVIVLWLKLRKNHILAVREIEDQKQSQKNRDETLISLKQAEYLALQNQINPHFLYNTLEAIRGDALSEGMRQIADTTKALSTFFRYTVTDVGNSVTLEDEISNVENYFTIQKYRFAEKLQMDITMEDDLSQAQMPKLTLQPIVENAVSHGLERKTGTGTVRITVEATERTLWITVEDDGVGIREEQLYKLNARLQGRKSYVEDSRPKKGGIALVNVNSRIKLLYGSDYGMQIYSSYQVGTKVEINLPLIIEQKGNG